MTQRTFEAYERWAPTYDAHPSPQTALETTDVLAALGVSAEDKVLDAACGTGRYIGRLVAEGVDVVGFDFSPAMLRQARASYPGIHLVQADLEQPLPFRSGEFSHVLCTQALKHLPDLKSPLRELANTLRRGGVLVFSVTHPDMDWTDYELSQERDFVLGEESDIFHHTKHHYLSALEAAGFELEEFRAVSVNEAIAHYLMPRSVERVRGRPQIAVVRAVPVNEAAT